MKKYFLKCFVFAVLILSTLNFAPTHLIASDLAQKVQQTYRDTHSFQADFTQSTHIELLDRDQVEEGILTFAKPGQFLIHYSGKNERDYISDGKTLWIYHPQEKEVEVIEKAQNILSREALVFLGGLAEMTQEFKVTEEKAQDKAHQLTLVPKSKSSPFLRLLLQVDASDSFVHEMTLFPKSGNQSHYVFSNIHRNINIPDSVFKFKKTNVKVIHPIISE